MYLAENFSNNFVMTISSIFNHRICTTSILIMSLLHINNNLLIENPHKDDAIIIEGHFIF
jgi:hypothetical protein